MSDPIKAIFENGVLKPLSDVKLAEHQEVSIIIVSERDDTPSMPHREGKTQEKDYIVASNQAYANLDPNNRHELDIWDVTLNDGLDEY